ncbi:hypothetical protein [Thiothrix lacustris]|uniref:hypothetical protein n=1 Tax=Thiothrix lacustris TaxID=525917 RepID=UPI0027E4A9EE|nr:hypothetical protein [Thiothrix lacustris]WMP16499.1 hypothetical protein RCS87_14035 [Thiothrix lacustris]
MGWLVGVGKVANVGNPVRGCSVVCLAVVAVVIEDELGDGSRDGRDEYEHGISPWVR